MKNQKQSRILFPAAAFVFICVRLGTTEFSISMREYISLAVSISIPFLLFYIVEIVRYFRKKQEERLSDTKALAGSVLLLVLGILSLFSNCFAEYPKIQIF